PSPAGYRVSADVFNEMLAEQQSLMQIARVNSAGQRDFLVRALEQAETRVAILAQQKEQNAELIAADEAEEARARELLAGGLTNATRLADARRAVVLTATRLLETEENLARAELDVTRMTREVDEFEETRTTTLLAERDAARTRIYLAKLRMDNLSRLLSGSNAMLSDTDILPEVEATVVIYRKRGNRTEEIQAGFDEQVLPGDTLDVTLQPLELLDATDTAAQ
ncbi:MAG: hypothetical protein AAF813_09655, partial [Pseudomonadota bacterium]